MYEKVETAVPVSTQEIERDKVLCLLDFCKGLAILWIVVVHAAHGGFGWQGVHIFIVLGGFTLTFSRLTKGGERSWKQWYLKRAERILPTYWLIVIAGFLLVVVLDALVPAAQNIKSFSEHVWRLAADLTFVRNFSYKTMLADPNSALWFIGLTVSFYLAFPWLYSSLSRREQGKALIGFLLLAALTEFVYRAAIIYSLDGVPVGYGHGFLKFFGRVPRAVQNVSQDFPFQLWAPFGIFVSRVGEYALGMVAAVWFTRDAGKFSRLFINRRSAFAGFAVWLCGNALLYVGLWGWVFADFVIAAGLVVWVANLAEFFRARIAALFRWMSVLGVWSYYLFLTHLLIGYASARLYIFWAGSALRVLLVFSLVIACVVAACRLLRRFDQSELPKIIIRMSVGRLLRA